MSKPKHASHSAAHDDHRPNVKLYIGVFAALLALTGLTVFISTFHLPRPQAIALGLLVAAVKASLVAAIFMHLWGESKLIFKILLVTVAGAAMLVMPMLDFHLASSRLLEHANIAAQHPDEGEGRVEKVSETATLTPPAPAAAPKAAKAKGRKK